MQLDVMHLKRKQEEVAQSLVVFCPKCRKEHENGQCRLNTVEVCIQCVEKNPIDKCPLLPSYKAAMQGQQLGDLLEYLYFVNQQRPNFSRPFQPHSHPYFNLYPNTYQPLN